MSIPFRDVRIPALGPACAPRAGRRAWGFLGIVAVLVGRAAASDLDEFKVKREAVFEFAQRPAVTREGDRITIAFETKGFCDVTVAIEEAAGAAPRIVRHLASGVLGPNAPDPFQKDSKKQVIVWDGKDDQGIYIDDKDAITVRVSLGLSPHFERNLFHSPKKRMSGFDPPLVCPVKEGVFVYEHGACDYLRVYDHEGNYVRTVYPFPANRLETHEGLRWHTFERDGTRLPLKNGAFQTTLLTCGGARGMDVRDGRIFLAGQKLNRFATDGTSGGMALTGPQIGFPTSSQPKAPIIAPKSVAVSPDGTWLYSTGYAYTYSRYGVGGYPACIHIVARTEALGQKPAEVWLGEYRFGTDNAHFHEPSSVACDGEGRVYVADYGNDRVQVFSPEGKHLKTIAVRRPVQVAIHHRTNEIYVFSWKISSAGTSKDESVPSALRVLGPFENPEERAAYPVPLAGMGYQSGEQYRAALDSHTDPPTIWLVPGYARSVRYHGTVTHAQAGIRLLAPVGRELAVKRDFGLEAAKAVVRLQPPRHGRQRLYFDPSDQMLYVGENGFSVEGKSFADLVKIDPETGGESIVRLPMDAEDMAFDLDGHAYLRTEKVVARFDSRTWKEVPFDYGEELKAVGFSPHSDGRRVPTRGAIVMPSTKNVCFHMAGMDVSPRKHLVVTCWNPKQPPGRRAERHVGLGAEKKRYSSRLYPGRAPGWDIHIWDERGRALFVDALPGFGGSAPPMHGIYIDKDDNLYFLAKHGRLFAGTPYFNHGTGTMVKVKAGQVKVLSREGAPIALSKDTQPPRPQDVEGLWIEGAEWFYAGAGYRGASWCSCMNCRPALDLFARSFVPEMDHYSVAVLDTNGNLILRVGQYGNEDSAGPGSKVPLGGDEVGLFYPAYLATQTDRRLFVADLGNARIVSVTLGYHASERIALKDVGDSG